MLFIQQHVFFFEKNFQVRKKIIRRFNTLKGLGFFLLYQSSVLFKTCQSADG